MTAALQPRDHAGRFASTLPTLPPMVSAVAEYERDAAAVSRRLDRSPVIRPALPDVPASVVSVCCAACVYGQPS